MMPNDVFDMVADALRVSGIAANSTYRDEWYEMDDATPRGYIDIEGVLIYPHAMDDGQIGWGVAAEVCIPGCHTMSNGDPGYPDEYDSVDIALPEEERHTFSGPRKFPRAPMSAVTAAITALVGDRLKHWYYDPHEVSDG